jgi:hypothetical protein
MVAKSEREKIPLITLVILGVALLPGLAELWRSWTDIGPDGLTRSTIKLPVLDFANLWSGGWLARHDLLAILFDEQAYRAWLRARFTAGLADSEWSYPPTMLLLGVPVSLLGLVPGYLVWNAGTAALLFAVLRYSGLSRRVALVSVLSPAMVQSLICGQNGALTGALLCGALLLVPRRPAAAGLCAGLLTVKPQLGLLLPLAFAAGRRWRTIAMAACAALGLAGAAAAAFGPETWVLFWTRTQPLMVRVMEANWPRGFMLNSVTVFFFARSAGLGLQGAYAVQGLAMIGAAIMTARIWRIPHADPALRMACTIPLVLLATPYAYNYDMAGLNVAAAVLLARRGWRFDAMTALAWCWPGLSWALTTQGLLVSPFVLVAFAAAAWRALRRDGLVVGPPAGERLAYAGRPGELPGAGGTGWVVPCAI